MTPLFKMWFYLGYEQKVTKFLAPFIFLMNQWSERSWQFINFSMIFLWFWDGFLFLFGGFFGSKTNQKCDWFFGHLFGPRSKTGIWWTGGLFWCSRLDSFYFFLFFYLSISFFFSFFSRLYFLQILKILELPWALINERRSVALCLPIRRLVSGYQ